MKKKQSCSIKTLFAALCMTGGGILSNAQSLNYEWGISAGGIDLDLCGGPNSIAVDRAGNVYVTGTFGWLSFGAPADFNPGTGTAILNNAGGPDAFLAKYDANGQYLWAFSIGSSGEDRGYGVAVDDTGNVYITGTFGGTADFNPGAGTAMLTPASPSGQNAYVAKYDPSGNYLWAGSIGGSTGFNHGKGIVLDTAGNVYVTGYFNYTSDFDMGTDTAFLAATGSFNATDVYLARYDAGGNYVWAKSMGGHDDEWSSDITVDAAGNVYITGMFGRLNGHPADFDPGTGVAMLISAGIADGFLARYDANGNYVWAKSIGGTGFDEVYGIAVDNNSNVYVTGYFVGTADFNPGGSPAATLTSLGLNDAFIARYDAGGNYVWAGRLGRGQQDQGVGVDVDAAGNVYVTGWFNGTVDFDFGQGTATLAAAGDQDAFIAKYDSGGSYLWAGRLGGDAIDNGTAIAVDIAGNVYLASSFELTGDFDPGPDTATLTAAGIQDVYIVKLSCGDTTSAYLSVTECRGSYTLNGTVYTASGIYTQVLPNASGCDSTITLDLTFASPEQPVITVDQYVLGVAGTYAGYQWIKNGTDIDGATNATHIVTENADYQVRVTNDEGCEETSAVYAVNNVGIDDDVNGRQISIYPNPVGEMIHINSPVPVDVALTGADGRMVLHAEHAKQISVRHLPDGIYFLRVSDREGRLIKVEKLVKATR